MGEHGYSPGPPSDSTNQGEEGAAPEPLRDDEPAIPDAADELGGSGEVTPGDDNFPEPGRGRASEPGRPLRSP
jgi:hypothetical protein